MSTELEYIGKKPDPEYQANQQEIRKNIELPEGKNAFAVGPVTVKDGVTVVVPDNSVFVVL